jgi:hypothetical protein
VREHRYLCEQRGLDVVTRNEQLDCFVTGVDRGLDEILALGDEQS